jgi:hypothetical protein
MTTSEDQPQHVVVEGCAVFLRQDCRIEQRLMRQLGLLRAKGDLPANAVDRLVARHIDQPRPRIGRHVRRRPALQRGSKGLLERILGKIEIADKTDQRGERPPRLVAKYFFDLGWQHYF